ncbi:MAG: glycine--tRNA ligase subunit beta, partial [Candidatus Melainabacteria bacterium]|nr:glycine--tRNA ligase subunit beta [Candidatus Melainabacteria bacterium]
MPTYLLEIGTEELPANHLTEAQERLKMLMSQALRQANLTFKDICCLGTPRRLACLIEDLSIVQDTAYKKVKGPPVKSSFDVNGKPLPSAIGFAQKHGLSIEELNKEEVNGVEYLMANLTIAGKPTPEVLPTIIPAVIEQISGERLMRWGSSSLRFSRPIRWLVSVLGQDEVPIVLDGLKSSRQTYGHRILCPGRINVNTAESYIDDLRAAYVLVNPQERKAVIEQHVLKASKEVSGRPRQLKGALLSEVVNLTEWPCAVLGEFSHEYLELPDVLIETVMVHHQRYFPVEQEHVTNSSSIKLLPYFVSVANNDQAQAQPIIKLGNERVLRARLSDGRFFFFDDQKIKLSQRKAALG